MNLYGTEKIWRYLHDDPKLVSTNMFVTNTYLYALKLVEMLSLNPEFVPELKFRMYTERINDSDFFLQMRAGYGKTEYRIVKLMKIKSLGDSFKKIFPELVPEEPKKDNLSY